MLQNSLFAQLVTVSESSFHTSPEPGKGHRGWQIYPRRSAVLVKTADAPRTPALTPSPSKCSNGSRSGAQPS